MLSFRLNTVLPETPAFLSGEGTVLRDFVAKKGKTAKLKSKAVLNINISRSRCKSVSIEVKLLPS